MQLTNEELLELESLGSAFMDANECAILLQVDADEFKELLADETTEVHQYYHKGRLASVYKTRASIVRQAADGSSPAQALALELIKRIDMRHA